MKPEFIKPGLIFWIRKINDEQPHKPRIFVEGHGKGTQYTWPDPDPRIAEHNATVDSRNAVKALAKANRAKVGRALIEAFVALRRFTHASK